MKNVYEFKMNCGEFTWIVAENMEDAWKALKMSESDCFEDGEFDGSTPKVLTDEELKELKMHDAEDDNSDFSTFYDALQTDEYKNKEAPYWLASSIF